MKTTDDSDDIATIKMQQFRMSCRSSEIRCRLTCEIAAMLFSSLTCDGSSSTCDGLRLWKDASGKAISGEIGVPIPFSAGRSGVLLFEMVDRCSKGLDL